MEIIPKAKRVIDTYNSLRGQRGTWESHWQDVADYMLPRKADITQKRSKGDKRHEQIFDGTATHALELLAASLHGMLTSTTSAWFSLKYRNEMVDQDDSASEWLEDCNKVMLQAFSRSNFQQEIFELYHDLIAFGTAGMFIQSDEDDDLRFKTIHISELFISENQKGLVDTVIRKFILKARSLPAMFPKAELPHDIMEQVRNNPQDDVVILHAVMPNEMGGIYENNVNKPYSSCYVHEDTGFLLSESGFNDFPYVVPRYLKASNEIYGRSPAMNALPDVKMLNTMAKVSIKAAQKQIDPPLMVPDDGFVLPVRTVPGGLNFYRSGTRERIEPLNIGSNQPLGLQMEEQRRKAIRENFFVDQLLSVQGSNMTATEVMQKQEEKMRILGPVLGRLQSELLQPLITRCFNILLKQKKFQEVPEFLANQVIEIEYVSPIAKAQKSGDLSSIMRGIEVFGAIQQVSPVFDYLDVDGLVAHLKDVIGLPAKILRSRAEVEQMREQKQAQAEQMQQMQQEMQMAEAAGKAAPAIKAVADE